MYWTSWKNTTGASVFRSGTDGSSPSEFIPNLKCSSGITIDFDSSKLYWADCGAKKIQSCSLYGGEVATVAELSSGPFGIALHKHELFWSLPDTSTLQRRNKDGGDIISVYNGTARIRHLVAPDWALPTKRINPCGTGTCPGVCVLTSKSHKCL